MGANANEFVVDDAAELTAEAVSVAMMMNAIKKLVSLILGVWCMAIIRLWSYCCVKTIPKLVRRRRSLNSHYSEALSNQ